MADVQAAQLVLASASPRRKQLLAQIGISCLVDVADVDETPYEAEAAETYAHRLATAKACVVSARTHLPVLAADTVVVKNGLILGKPVDKADAMKMLHALQGGEHEVITAVALQWRGQSFAVTSKSRVWFRALSEAEREVYWLSGEPVDKAGSYAIQGLAATFIERMDGSFSGVMGLPLFETSQLLKSVGIDILKCNG